MRVEEERIHAPREGFPSDVDVTVFGNRRELASVLCFEVFLMFSMFLLDALNPKRRKDSWFSSQYQVVSDEFVTYWPELRRRNLFGDVSIASCELGRLSAPNLPPQIGRFYMYMAKV